VIRLKVVNSLNLNDHSNSVCILKYREEKKSPSTEGISAQPIYKIVWHSAI